MLADIRDDARKVGALLASGFPLDEIRSEMKLSRRQLMARLSMLRRRAKDVGDTWPKFVAKIEARYRQYEGIRQRAIQQNKLDTALRAIENMTRLDAQLVEVGQALGIYEKVADKHIHTIENPTLGMFHSTDLSEGAIDADYSTEDGEKKLLK